MALIKKERHFLTFQIKFLWTVCPACLFCIMIGKLHTLQTLLEMLDINADANNMIPKKWRRKDASISYQDILALC